MTAKVKKLEKEPMKRVNTRIKMEHDDFIKSQVGKVEGEYTEGDVHRALLDEAITARKSK